jgi:hypothetical protein
MTVDPLLELPESLAEADTQTFSIEHVAPASQSDVVAHGPCAPGWSYIPGLASGSTKPPAQLIWTMQNGRTWHVWPAVQSESVMQVTGWQNWPPWQLSPIVPSGQSVGGGPIASARAAADERESANAPARAQSVNREVIVSLRRGWYPRGAREG